MRLFQAGIRGGVALLGTEVSAFHLDWLMKARKILLMLDGDASGRKAEERITAQLGSQIEVKSFHLPEGVEPEDLTDWCLNSVVQRFIP
jgi:DNA primase